MSAGDYCECCDPDVLWCRNVTNRTHAGTEPRYSPYYIRKTKEDIPMQTITRAALIQTIEAAIGRARTLDPTEKLALRLVALTADEVSIGDFANCPLTQAGQGSDSPASHNTEYEPQERFYDCFDPLVRRVSDNYQGRTLTVVE